MYIDHTDSTNTLVRQQYLDAEDGFCLYTFDQRAGRGQSGNSWQTEPGKNLLFTILLQRPHIAVEQAFVLNMAVSLGVADCVPGSCVKWPNDIYMGDRKVCGILIENILSSQGIEHSIVGVGLNVNQTEWSDAIPNPTSMLRETGTTYDLHALMTQLQNAIQHRLSQINDPVALKRDYMQHLYRRNGFWPYVEREVDITPTAIVQQTPINAFDARIADVNEQGELVLEHTDHSLHTYHFKQVKYVIV